MDTLPRAAVVYSGWLVHAQRETRTRNKRFLIIGASVSMTGHPLEEKLIIWLPLRDLHFVYNKLIMNKSDNAVVSFSKTSSNNC